MTLSTITSKGQTTIPKQIRDALGLKAGDQVRFTLLADGTVIMRSKRGSIKDLAGILYDPDRKPIPIEDMKYGR
jgi:AbrB family looped-hinge helix DNA binding protein